MAFDNSMTHKAKSPDDFDASKLNKSDGGANIVMQRDGWCDSIIDGVTIRIIQKMQTNGIPPVQLGLLSILRARGVACMRLPNGEYSERELNKLCRECKETGHKEDPLSMLSATARREDNNAQKNAKVLRYKTVFLTEKHLLYMYLRIRFHFSCFLTTQVQMISFTTQTESGSTSVNIKNKKIGTEVLVQNLRCHNP